MADDDDILDRIDRALINYGTADLPKLALEPIKLTQEQFDAVKAANPPIGGPTGYGLQYSGLNGPLGGVPVELVDTVEESTPHKLKQLTVRDVARAFDVPLEMLQPPGHASGQNTAHKARKPWWRRWLRRTR